MKSHNLGDAIQILANLGVIAGIIFLALEIHQNSEQLAGQSRYNYYQGRAQVYHSLALDQGLADIFQRKLTGEALSPVEELRISSFFTGNLTLWEYEYDEYQRGLISEREFNLKAKRQAFAASRPLIEPVWKFHRETAPEDFVKFMEREVLPQASQD